MTISPAEAAQVAAAAVAAGQLQEQQMLTAWIQAAAAVAQAIGAVGAIAVSVWLARESAKREIAADHAATARAEAAEKAATERAEEAERRAETRERMRTEAAAAQIEAEAKDAHNGPIDLVVSLVDEAISAATARAQEFRAKTDASHYGYQRMGSEATRAISAIDAALVRTTNVPTHLAMTDLKDALLKGADKHASFKVAGEVAAEFEKYASEMADLRGPLVASRQ